jgi:3'(2'), 5'-bisphosphate nucleotidase
MGEHSIPANGVADDVIAARVAAQAGKLLMELRSALAEADPKVLRDTGDRQSHQLITELLAGLRPDDPVLSEEGSHDGARIGSSRVWIVDPLDGTREFGELTRDDWAVHVALCIDGQPVAAAVALPAQGLTLSTAAPPVLTEAGGEPLRILVSRTRAPEFVAGIATALGAEVIPMGSAGAKAIAVAQGRADAYIHAGGQYEWDSAAPVGVCLAAGLHASRIDGTALEYNRPDPWLPDILVCRRELAPRLLELLREAS